MLRKPKRRTLPTPSVFKSTAKNQWVCEYHEFDEKGQVRTRRKSFLRELRATGVEGNLTEQREAALRMKKQLITAERDKNRLRRRELDQTFLTAKQLREAKAAFAIFDEIPDRNKSLVDAVVLYREHLRLAIDSPPLQDCIDIFLGRKLEAVEKKLLSHETYRTLKWRLNPFRNYFAEKVPSLKIGEVSAQQLIVYLEGLEVGERTLRNTVNDLRNFFNDAANPKDENRFINKNPMDGVYIHFKRFNATKALKTRRDKRRVPKVLSLQESKHVLEIAFEGRKHGFLGFAVCGLFLGMRPSEIFDMVKQADHWERLIKLEEGVLRIEGFGKQRDQRIIVMPYNAVNWLRFIQGKGYPLCFNYDPRADNVRYASFRARAFLPPIEAERIVTLRRSRKSGHKYTPDEKAFSQACNKKLAEYQDVLRHTFGTNFYYANNFDKNLTVQQMGNSGEVFIEHYRGLLDRPSDAIKYFELRPE